MSKNPDPKPKRTAALALAALLATGAEISPAHAQDATEAEEESEEIVVQATRSGRRVQDEPIRVEVIGREEIEEKLLMTPGNISMLVAETGGVRVQVTAPALGASNIRMQGMNGRYTSLLADGLPLYGSQASFGLLQIPPTDLGQVEVIKGAASALYGPSALGGVINLVSRRPGAEPQAEFLANITSRDGQDLTAYAATPFGGDWSGSLVGGYHRQSSQDLDSDGWIDMPAYDRWTGRSRLFWEDDGGNSLYLTAGAMTEKRTGGTLSGAILPGGQPFVQAQDTDRFDAGLVGKVAVEGIGTIQLRASGMEQRHVHRFGISIERDRHRTLFTEGALSGGSDRTPWVAGIAFQGDAYRSRTFPAFDYSYSVPAVFAQVEHRALDVLTLSGSARFDFHNRYGTHFSPRVSALYNPGKLTMRASIGRGFYAPTPFVAEIDAAGLSRLAPLSGLRAETVETASFDIGYKAGPLEANIALFGSRLHDAVRLRDTGNLSGPAVELFNLRGVTRTAGAEFLLRYRWRGFTATGSYVHIAASEPDPAGAGRRQLPVTPRNTAGMVVMWERHGRGRIGIEAYYTGPQSLEDNPYRSRSRPYVELGMLGEISFGKVSLFINAENLLNVRQTRYDPLVLPARARDGRWTVEAWGPLEGFTLNGGVRLRFGGH
ncbi:TonB-dependent receptor [Sphingomonas sp. AOB5]|uniref:TonB-dependent receptor plug domain-containing protein n=1 Tax=Sphingomonas sp. AOB5 TaxID=3034017 RepID=UPI0023F6186E|nr:TonB-dependent receptor [Sphingomonas sp. AOB5]MDF7774549.1 TonB-dependent receptor [Sphingomonas sp. AOB5]